MVSYTYYPNLQIWRHLCLYMDKSAISVTAEKTLLLSRCFADQSLWVINHEMFKEVQTYQVIFGCSDLFESHLRFKTYHSLWWALALCILKELRDLEEIFSIWCLLSLVVMKFCFVWSQGMSCSEKNYTYILKTATFLSVMVPQSISGPESFFERL